VPRWVNNGGGEVKAIKLECGIGTPPPVNILGSYIGERSEAGAKQIKAQEIP